MTTILDPSNQLLVLRHAGARGCPDRACGSMRGDQFGTTA